MSKKQTIRCKVFFYLQGISTTLGFYWHLDSTWQIFILKKYCNQGALDLLFYHKKGLVEISCEIATLDHWWGGNTAWIILPALFLDLDPNLHPSGIERLGGIYIKNLIFHLPGMAGLIVMGLTLATPRGYCWKGTTSLDVRNVGLGPDSRSWKLYSPYLLNLGYPREIFLKRLWKL